MIYQCICGKVHKMTKKGILCSGHGHNIYLAPNYFDYKPFKKQQQQLNLF